MLHDRTPIGETQSGNLGRAAATLDSLERWFSERLAALLGKDARELDLDQPFQRYGLESTGAAQLAVELSQKLGQKIQPTIFWDQPTPRRLLEALGRSARSQAPAPTTAASERQKESAPATNEPIAVVGLACRFPGAPNPTSFWELLRNGRHAIREVPPDRWGPGALTGANLSVDAQAASRWAGFIEHVQDFDALFFNISPREALQMDPQQRLLLEVAWEALENAGLPADHLKGSTTGVFCGVIWCDYAALLHRIGMPAIGPYSATGTHYSIIANRLSYFFGFEGPSLVVDTACSSSLVAVHLACQALRAGECTLALAGGVNLLLAPENMAITAQLGALSPTGRARSFDAGADGFVRGEGAGIVVLKPLSRALADGDPIWCVLRGSAVNSDGASNGLTAPSSRAQEALLRRAYRNAGIAPEQVQYIEAHGTGTRLGDPIELGAIRAVMGANRTREQPLWIGSAKTNIGHLEGAAGISGLIKVALSLRHGQLPASLHFQELNPLSATAAASIAVSTSLQAWPRQEGALARAGISAFGFGGTNCHLVVEEFPVNRAGLLGVAADDEESLRGRIRSLQSKLRDPDLSVPALCAAEAVRSDKGELRAAFSFRTRNELDRQMARFLTEEPTLGIRRGSRSTVPGSLVFVFSGHGSQWIGMGRELLAAEPIFRAKILQCDRLFVPLSGWSLHEELWRDDADSRIMEIEVAGPVLFAVQVALSSLWRSWGIVPDAIIGHSVGEIAAAHVAGILDLPTAIRVIHHYSYPLHRITGRGKMALLALPLEDIERILAKYAGRLSVAAHNSFTTAVISGDAEAIESLVQELTEQKFFCRVVGVGVAGHHPPHIAPLRREMFAALDGIRPRRAMIPMRSTVTGLPLAGPELNASYWVRNVTSMVRFHEVIDALARSGMNQFLEVGPHPVLLRAIEETSSRHQRTGLLLSSMRKGESERATMLDSLGAFFVSGREVDWLGVYPSGIAPKQQESPIPLLDNPIPRARQAAPILLPLSACGRGALRGMAQALLEQLNQDPAVSIVDLGYTSAFHRCHHDDRLAVVASSREQLTETLQSYLREDPHANLIAGKRSMARRPRLIFVFPGQGSQWVGMGKQLLAQEPIFRAAIERCDRAARSSYLPGSLLQELEGDGNRLRENQVEVVQPAIFAMQVALAELWSAFGVTPDAVVGHSMGELAAAYTAGALALEDAMRVVCVRSRLVRETRGQGMMVLVELSLEEAQKAIVGYENHVAIAASNAPNATVLSGEPNILRELLEVLELDGVFCKRIKVDFASHSPRMDPLLDTLLSELQGLSPRPGSIPFFSTVTGRYEDGIGLDAWYWAQNLRAPVLFAPALQKLAEEGPVTIVEISPHPVLCHSMEETLRRTAKSGMVLSSLRREEDERLCMLRSLGILYTLGYPVVWEQLYQDGGRLIQMPNYQWQRERYWFPDDWIAHNQTAVAMVPTLPQSAQRPVNGTESATVLREELLRTSIPLRRPWLERYLQRIVCAILRLPSERCDPHSPLTSLGMDSITALDIRLRLEKELQLNLMIGWLINGSSISEIAAELERLLPPDVAASPVAQETAVHLSYEQQNAEFLGRLSPDAPVLAVSRTFRLRGSVQLTSIATAIHALVQRHSALRTVFTDTQGRSHPLLQQQAEADLSVYNASEWSEVSLSQHIQTELGRPFDLKLGPLLRTRLYLRANNEAILLWSAHRMVADEISLNLLTRELSTLCGHTEEERLPPQTVQYRDYADWQTQTLDGQAGADLEQFWVNYVGAEPAILEVPTDYLRPAIPTFRGASVGITLPTGIGSQSGNAASPDDRKTLAACLTAFALLLHRRSEQSLFLIGVEADARMESGCSSVIGSFSRPLAVRIDFTQDCSLGVLITRVEQELSSVKKHAAYPLDRLLERLRIERPNGMSPLVRALLVFRPSLEESAGQADQDALSSSFVIDGHIDLCSPPAPVDLSLIVERTATGLVAQLVYATDLFRPDTADIMAEELAGLLRLVWQSPATSLATCTGRVGPNGSSVLSRSDLRVLTPADSKKPNRQLVADVLTQSSALSRAFVGSGKRSGVVYLEPRLKLARLMLTTSARIVDGSETERHFLLESLSPGGATVLGPPPEWQVGVSVRFYLPQFLADPNIEISGQVAWRSEARAGLSIELSRESRAGLQTKLTLYAGGLGSSIGDGWLGHRFAVSGPCYAEWGDGQSVELTSLNLSLGGICLREPPPDWQVGTQVQLQVNIPGARQSIGLLAKVCWVRDRRGGARNCGLQFLPTAAQQKQLLDALSEYVNNYGLIIPDLAGQLRRSYSRQYLPDCFVVVDKIPIDIRGDVVEEELPLPPPASSSAPHLNRPKSPLEAMVASTWAEVLGVDRVGRDEDFFRAGSDAAAAYQLLSKLSRDLRCALSLRHLIINPTISELAEEIANLRMHPAAILPAGPLGEAGVGGGRPPGEPRLRVRSAEERTLPWLTKLRPAADPRMRLFCFSYAGGSTTNFRGWENLLARDIELMAVQLPGRESRLMETPLDDFFALSHAISYALAPCIDRPFALFGHSLGGLLCFQVARMLRWQLKTEPAHLFISGVPAPELAFDRSRLIWDMAERDLRGLIEMMNGTPNALLQDMQLFHIKEAVLRADIRLLSTFRYVHDEPFRCPLTAFGGSEDALVQTADLNTWRNQTEGNFSLQILSGDHFFVHSREEELLNAINLELRKFSPSDDSLKSSPRTSTLISI